MKKASKCILAGFLVFTGACSQEPEGIDRKALVERHNLHFSAIDSSLVPQVGNGEIAYGIDPTGLQGFYGLSMAQWGWHHSPLPEGERKEDFQMTKVEVHGRTPGYPVSMEGQESMYWWLRQNPHRINLGRLSFQLDGQKLESAWILEISQELDLWKGQIRSSYLLDGIPVEVLTLCHPESGALVVKVHSDLLATGRLSVELAFPYGHHGITGCDWTLPDRHTTRSTAKKQQVVFERRMDQDSYRVELSWSGDAILENSTLHHYVLTPAEAQNQFEFACTYFPDQGHGPDMDFGRFREDGEQHWKKFWTSGGAIDLSGSSDPRWEELERRIVLSQYLLAVNEAGSLPPQESGLLLNSGWYGKFHLEMHWWHGAHYQLWDRWSLFDRSLGWYRETLPVARGIAKRQGYEGARWPKMIGPDGRFAPSRIGPWLIWQQPHPLFYAEQHYRLDPSTQTLEWWKDVVFETAEFMASYAHFNPDKGVYELGPWLINAAENNQRTKHETLNPAFELAYWRYGLRIAIEWRTRLGLAPKEQWAEVLRLLAPLPVKDGVYLMYENVPDMWTEFNRSHIDVIGPGAFLPAHGVELEVLGSTVDKVLKEWRMESTWGWDFPWLAMAAARAGKPEDAIDALLMENPKNRYNYCGINEGGPAHVYFPGNGGLLYAVAMMAAGWDGAPDYPAPGFPQDGTWLVRAEGLNKAQ